MLENIQLVSFAFGSLSAIISFLFFTTMYFLSQKRLADSESATHEARAALTKAEAEAKYFRNRAKFRKEFADAMALTIQPHLQKIEQIGKTYGARLEAGLEVQSEDLRGRLHDQTQAIESILNIALLPEAEK